MPHVHYLKVTFPSSNAMHDAAEQIQRAAQHSPMLLIGDPPLVLWTDADIFAGTALYTTKTGLDVLTPDPHMQSRPIDVGDIPIDAQFIVGDDSHRRGPGTSL
jgi:hypothetical protein